MRPDQNCGMATAPIEKRRRKLSSLAFLLLAARIPSGMPTTPAMVAAMAARTRVFGRAWVTRLATGCLTMVEIPRSPLNMPEM